MVVNARQSETEDVDAGGSTLAIPGESVHAGTSAAVPSSAIPAAADASVPPPIGPTLRPMRVRMPARGWVGGRASDIMGAPDAGAPLAPAAGTDVDRAIAAAELDVVGAPNAAIMRGDSRHERPSPVSARSSTNFWSASGAGII